MMSRYVEPDWLDPKHLRDAGIFVFGYTHAPSWYTLWGMELIDEPDSPPEDPARSENKQG